MKTAIYIRVSTTEQAKEGYSLANQRRKLLSFCDLKGWNVVEIYSDEGVSASSLKERPEAMRMLSDLKQGIFENILILKVDRLCRNTRDLLEVVDLAKKYNVRLNAVDEQIDYTTPTGKMMLTLLGSFAELERSTINERMQSGRHQKARAGIKSKTGVPLFGYEYIDGKYIANKTEADIVKLIFNKITEGESIRAIARYLIKNNIPGKSWTAAAVRNLLLNPTYKGFTFSSLYRQKEKSVDFSNAILNKAVNVEPIISEEMWDQTYNLLSVRSNGNVRKFAKSNMWFIDVAYCNDCGWKLFARNAKGKTPEERRLYYRCYYNTHSQKKDCSFTSIEQKVLERLFLEFMSNIELNLLDADNPKNIEQQDESKILLENLKQSKVKYTSRKEKLLEKYLDGIIDDDQYTSTSAEIVQELEAIENRIAELKTGSKGQTKNMINLQEFRERLKTLNLPFHEIWARLNDAQKRLFVSTAIKKILIARSRIVSIEFN